MKRLAYCVLIGLALTFGCDKEKSTPTPTPAANPSASAANVTPPATAPSTQAAPAAAAVVEIKRTLPAAANGLPWSQDVLPSGEVSGGWVVVFGDGYRYQVPSDAYPTQVAGVGTAYTGSIEGLIGVRATITEFATKEPFTGDLAALVKRQKDAVTAAGGKIDLDAPVKIMTADSFGDAYRFLAQGKQNIDVQVLALNKGYAYIFHAQAPQAPNVFANVGSDLMLRGSTFHVDPPPAK